MTYSTSAILIVFLFGFGFGGIVTCLLIDMKLDSLKRKGLK